MYLNVHFQNLGFFFPYSSCGDILNHLIENYFLSKSTFKKQALSNLDIAHF